MHLRLIFLIPFVFECIETDIIGSGQSVESSSETEQPKNLGM